MRKIIHIDADSFFASVECRDNPKLIGRPIAVGGDPGRRGVICTASYEARHYGVRSAMASAHAMRLCPDLLIIKPDMSKYKAASSAIHEIFQRYTEQIEPLSLDEAFLDVSDSDFCRGSATWLAQRIQQDIQSELGLSCSAGVAPVKFVAKIASDWQKPKGLTVVMPDQIVAFCAKLPVERLPGVGRVTRDKLARFGLYDGRDIREFGEFAMVKHFGTLGQQLYHRAWGRDDRPVTADRVRKTLSVERTFSEDIDTSVFGHAAATLFEDLKSRFDGIHERYLPTKHFVKLKFSDFSQTVLEAALPRSAPWAPSHFERLLHTAWLRHRLPVRLMGLGVRLQPQGGGVNWGQATQLHLF